MKHQEQVYDLQKRVLRNKTNTELSVAIVQQPKRTNNSLGPRQSSLLRRMMKEQNWQSILLLAIILLPLAACTKTRDQTTDTTATETNDTTKQEIDYQAEVQNGETVSIPQKVLDNKFGFLSGGEKDNPFVGNAGGAWVRPHPGPFLWDAMQKSESDTVDFSETDAIVTTQQKQNYGTLATLWPFAEWDQTNRTDADDCKVSDVDEFLPNSYESIGKNRPDYLPLHRCNPNDWDAYATWVEAIVERYDGDGVKDMLGLTVPIKYWEVMNEPDLESPEPIPTLDFYQSSPSDYAKLLIETNKTIKSADPEAQVLIAGAAGGNDTFLGFYRTVFVQPGVAEAFDIANVHCISNDSYDSFNVVPYKKLLEEFSLDKPIWVTEAEAMISSDADVNATQTKLSTAKALSLGAKRIFFTRYDFMKRMDLKDHLREETEPVVEIQGDDAQAAYLEITSQ